MKCLKALLSHGANPREEYEGLTAWSITIAKFAKILLNPKAPKFSKDSPNLIISEWLDVVEIFISHGASPRLLLSKTAHLVPKFARLYGRRHRESGELERLCRILEVEYESLEISDESEDESEDKGYYQRYLKRKRTDYVDHDSKHW